MGKLPFRLENYKDESDKRFTHYRDYAECITQARKSAIPIGISSLILGIGSQFLPESHPNKLLQITRSYGIIVFLAGGFVLSAYSIGRSTKRCQDMWQFLEFDSKEYVKENKRE